MSEVETTPRGGEEESTTEETPDTRWGGEGEETETETEEGDLDDLDDLAEVMDRVARPLWVIARALAKLVGVPVEELMSDDETDDGSEFSLESTSAVQPSGG